MSEEKETESGSQNGNDGTVRSDAKEVATKVASEGWKLAKQVGGFLKKKAEEKLDDTRQRLNEPKLTEEEQKIISDYRAISDYLPPDHLSGHPPLPKETMLNRREIRVFLSSPKVAEFIQNGEVARSVAEEARKLREEEEEKERIRLEAEAAERQRAREANEAADRIRTLEAEISEIEKFYSNTLNEVEVSISRLQSVLPSGAISQAGDLAFEGSRSNLNKNWLSSQSDDVFELGSKALYKAVRKGSATDAIQGSYFKRSLVSMTEPERAALRLADILHALGVIEDDEVLKARAAITWNRGECLISIQGSYGGNLKKREAAIHALKTLISTYFGEPAAGTEMIKSCLARVVAPGGEHPTIQAVLERYIVAGSRWMTPSESSAFLAKGPASPSALRLGQFSERGEEFLYDMSESLITVAAPGTGKSQAHVLRNLLYLHAPAVVLDIKGEMREHSARWREQAVGPVHVFSPTSPATSLHYNPLDLIPNDPANAWDDARNLADLLVVPVQQKGGDTYFEERARDMITTAILDVALSETDDKRTMTGVLDRLYLSDEAVLSEWFEHLESLNISQLRRQASALKGMPAKQREGILDSARRQLEIWQSPAIERLTSKTTFAADELRHNDGTLYLSVSLDDVKRYASVLRVIIGQTVKRLCQVRPEADTKTVTFFLDELPRLGRMDVIEEALDVGRGFGVRLWLFCQNTGQLETAYPNADGIMKSCAIRAFMNPDEKTAQQLSQNIGTRETLLDAVRRPLVEASQLAGPEFANKVLLFGRSSYAARLNKVFAYSDPVTKSRMNGD